VEAQYELYCLADPIFYDTPDQGRARGADRSFSISGRALPDGWRLDGVRAAIGTHQELLATSALYRDLIGHWGAAGAA
jgi:hypothetical protein